MRRQCCHRQSTGIGKHVAGIGKQSEASGNGGADNLGHHDCARDHKNDGQPLLLLPAGARPGVVVVLTNPPPYLCRRRRIRAVKEY